jgi:hypothetical protein
MADTNRFFSISELGEMPPPRWMITDMFEANALVMVAGPPGSYKSFLVLDWLLCIAAGRSWCGKPVEQAKVLYVLGEGRSSLLKRIQTWMHYNYLTPVERQALVDNFRVTFEVPQMAQKASVDNMLVGLQLEDYQPSVIAIDTFARSFVGMDENSQKDVGLWVESADRLRTMGYTVIFLHHTSKNTEFGVRYRGSTAIMGAMDTAMTLMREPEVPHGVKLAIVKQKDHDEGEPLFFSATVVHPPGVPEGSIVLSPSIKVDERFTEEGNKMEQMIDALIADPGFESDRARGRELSKQFGLSEEAAKNRIGRRRKVIAPEEATSTVPVTGTFGLVHAGTSKNVPSVSA